MYSMNDKEMIKNVIERIYKQNKRRHIIETHTVLELQRKKQNRMLLKTLERRLIPEQATLYISCNEEEEN